MKKDKKEVAVKEESAVVVKEESAIMRPATGRGFEEPTDNEDLIIPRAKLLQALSPEVQDDGMQQGLIINSLTKEVLPSTFIPIYKFTQWIRFNAVKKTDPGFDPAYEPKEIIWRSNDPSDERVIAEGAFGENGELPKATKFLNFLAYFPEMETPMPVILSFSKSSFRTGKELISLAKFAGGDMFGRQYKLSSIQKENELGKFYVLKIAPAGKPIADHFSVAVSLFDDFRPKTDSIIVHDDSVVDETDQE